MRCETAELELSARLDGAADRALDAELESHLATCERCRAFSAGTDDLRRAVRMEPVGPVPDLVPRIVDALERERPRTITRRRARLRAATVFLAGAAASAVVLGGFPGLRPGLPPALAKRDIPRLVTEASMDVDSYRATLDIVERNFHPGVGERRFEATIAFESPERFRADVKDVSNYPSKQWPRNDVRLVVDASRFLVEGPQVCPRESLPACPVRGRETRAARGREPFDGDTPLPSDIIVPVRTLSDTSHASVETRSRAFGRDVVEVTLPYRDAAPLFAYLHAAGSWRPFFPLDPVTVTLDRATWLPLGYEVRASDSAERASWAARNSLSRDDSGQQLFAARVRSFATGVRHPRGTFDAAAEDAHDAGFRDVDFGDLSSAAGFEPSEPGNVAGLRPYRAGTFAHGHPGEIVTTYARGLAWVRIRETRSWDEPTLFGDVSALAYPIGLNEGTAYAEPGTADRGHRLSIHGDDRDVYIESNLTYPGSFAPTSFDGREVPREWLRRTSPDGIVREQLWSIDRARELAPFLLVPAGLPPEYRLTMQVTTAGGRRGITLYYRRFMEPDGIGVRIHLAPDEALPPPLDPDTFAVRVRGVVGRYTPSRSELEWVSEGTYASVAARGFDLAGLVEIAESLEPPR